MRCEHCGSENKLGFHVCLSCGAKLPEITDLKSEPPDEDIADTAEKKSHSKKLSDKQKKRLTQVGILAAIIVLVSMVFFILFNRSDDIDYTKHPVVYSKNGEMYLRSYGKDESYKLTSGTEGDIHVSEKGDLVFFCDSYADGQFNLYYRKTDEKKPSGKNADSKGVKISDSVTGYQILDDGSKVLYQKGTELFLFDLKNSYYISSNVTAYRFSKDNSKILYITDRTLYVRGFDKNDVAEQIATEVDSLLTRDHNCLYFKKNNALYFADSNKEASKVLDDVHQIFSPKENVYFAVTRIKAEDSTVTYSVYKLDGSDCTESVSNLLEVNTKKRVLKRKTEVGIEQMLLLLDGSVVPIDNSFTIAEIIVSYDDRYIYCIDSPNADGKGDFMRYEISEDGISSPVKICDNARSFNVHGKNDEVITVHGDNFGVYFDGNYQQLSSGDARLMYVDIDSYSVFYIDNMNGTAGTLKKLSEGNVTEIDSEVSDFVFRGKNCYYIKNGNLYYKKGNNASVFVDSDVESILYKYISIKEGVY